MSAEKEGQKPRGNAETVYGGLTEIDHAYLLVSVIGQASTGQVPVALDFAEPVRRLG